MTIQELLETLEERVIKHITCNLSQYLSSDKDPNTLYYVTDRKAVFKGPIKLCDLYEIGDLRSLQTSDSSSLVAAINEVNQKAINNQGGGSVINDSTISPFAGFLPGGVTIIDGSSNSTNGEVLYDSATNRFIWKDLSGTFVRYYANWGTSYLYNTTSDSSASAKVDKLFSYNDKHYMVINGTLQDMSALNNMGNRNTPGIVKLSDSTSELAYDASRGIAATPKAVADLGVASKDYTDTQISNKIKLVQQLPDSPIDGVLYLIPETSLSKPTEE